VKAFGFQSTSDNPGSGDRTIEFTFDDGGHASGGAGPAKTDTVTQVVHVAPVNDAPDDVLLSSNSVAENSANGTVVGTLTAHDLDSSAPFGFSLVSNPGGKFAISGNQLVVNGALNFEATSSYSLTVRATDSLGAAFDKGLTVNVTDVADSPARGTDFIVNQTSVADEQDLNAVAARPGGGFVAVFRSFPADEVWARVYNDDGTAVGPDFLVAGGAGTQTDPNVTVLSGGKIVVAYMGDGTSREIYARVVNSDGTAAVGEIKLNSTLVGDQTHVDLAALGNNRFIATWWSGDNNSIRARLFDYNGATLVPVSLAGSGTNDFVVSTSLVEGFGSTPAVAALADGKFVITYYNANNPSEVWGHLYNADGTSAGSEFVVNSTTTGLQRLSDVAALPNGGFVAAYQSTDVNGVRARVFDGTGAALGPDFVVNATSGALAPAVTGLADGRFMVSWHLSGGDGNGFGIVARVFNADGTADGNEFVLDTTTLNDQTNPSLATLPNGRVVALWDSSDGADGGGGTNLLVRGGIVDIPNHPPQVSVPAGTAVVAEDHVVTLSGAGLADLDVSDTITVNLAVLHGTLAPHGALPGGVTAIDADGSDGTLSVKGTVAGINTLLGNGVDYTPRPNYHGPDALGIAAADDHGGSGSASAPITVTAVNDAPTGEATIIGTLQEGHTLLARSATIADVDGLGMFGYQWQRIELGQAQIIPGATQFSYTPTAADVGLTLQVVVSYGDGDGTSESLTSSATGPIGSAAEPDHAPAAEASKVLVLAKDADPVPLAIAAPTDQDAGGPLIVTVLRTPTNGVVLPQSGPAVHAGDVLTVAQLQELQFDPDAASGGAVSEFVYSVGDGVLTTVTNVEIDVRAPATLAGLFFRADDGTTGAEPWMVKSDGTLARVADIAGGSAASLPLGFTTFDGALYFQATTSAAGAELWKLKPDGTVSLAGDIQPGTAGSAPQSFVEFDGSLYFRATDASHGAELWKLAADGTSSLVADINPGVANSNAFRFTPFHNELFFTATDSLGSEVWKLAPGAAAPVRLTDINPGSASAAPAFYTEFNNELYFTATTAGVDHLWKIKADDTVVEVSSTVSTGLVKPVVYHNELYFQGNGGSNGIELWKVKADGSVALAADINTTGTGNSNPTGLTIFNDELYFQATTGANGSEVWKVAADGSASRLTDIVIGGGGSFPSGFTPFNGNLYFNATSSTGTELWKLDAAGHLTPFDINPGVGSSLPGFFQEFNGALYFQATDGQTGTELWKVNSSGTVARAADINPTGSSTPGASDGFVAATGGPADDIFVGGSGADTFTGNGGHNTFVFRPGFNNDTVMDFHAGSGPGDVLDVQGLFNNLAEVQAHAAQVGPDTLIAFDAHDSILLKNVVLANLVAEDFHFTAVLT
jgi:ELWxxDGT repeat protein